MSEKSNNSNDLTEYTACRSALIQIARRLQEDPYTEEDFPRNFSLSLKLKITQREAELRELAIALSKIEGVLHGFETSEDPE